MTSTIRQLQSQQDKHFSLGHTQLSSVKTTFLGDNCSSITEKPGSLKSGLSEALLSDILSGRRKHPTLAREAALIPGHKAELHTGPRTRHSTSTSTLWFPRKQPASAPQSGLMLTPYALAHFA